MQYHECSPACAHLKPRTADLFVQQEHVIHARLDRMFAVLMLIQWIGGIIVAAWISPLTWSGTRSEVHSHLWAAIFLGGLIASLPISLALMMPGRIITRYTIASAQMLFSGLLIHLSGGRIETHFHVFGSLAFLACYRDWHLILPATLIVVLDHALRGMFWPESIYGVTSVTWLRTMEHAVWVLFEDVVLIYAICTAREEMWAQAHRQALLEDASAKIEQRVKERTAELRLAQAQLLHSEKLAAVGQLASGIAHEINTPIQFVGDNVSACGDMVSDLDRLLRGHQALVNELREQDWKSPLMDAVELLEDEVDLEFVLEDIPKAIQQTLGGVDRVRRIVMALKNFAYSGNDGELSLFDVNEILRDTLVVSRNEWKYVAQVEEDFEDLPQMEGSPHDLSQVFLNLIVNASHAIRDQGADTGIIRISTCCREGTIRISISDTGCGIPEAIRHRIFDPFFTTKEVGRGSGQGLTIAHTIVVDRHHGQIDFETEPGVGTTFHISLPLRKGDSPIRTRVREFTTV